MSPHSPTRVAHLTTVHHPFDPRIFHKQLAALRDAGFDARLVAPHERTERVHGIPIHALPRPQNRPHRLALQPRVSRTARALNAALYHVHDPELLPLAGLLKKTTRARVVYDMHENYRSKGALLGRFLRALERWAFRWVDHVLIAEQSYRAIVEDRAVPHTYIPNYFRPIGEEPPAAPVDISSPPTRLLYTGTLSDGRGLRTMVHLAARIRGADRPETLSLVGICRCPTQRARTEEQIRRGGLGAVVDRVGWDTYVRPSTMPPHYRQADVGLALCEPRPNHVGSIPTKFYEYLHYGLPLICSDIPLWRRFVDRHECGAVVPPNDPAAVLDVLDEWQAHPERYRQCAENARAAAGQYRWGPIGKRLAGLYHRVLPDNVPELPTTESR
ncbi:glycosyltransferase family 4 protein [Salinibacter altiplanensis]|uniref:glycosyltransferase family 4 protein n=1 Tax=Salinibacter altiplanensis TaxID=1803181 RepID=UPI00131A5497|nr:glycosyltransferase family 4 protein [Salinibacter altiplanensis]